MLRLFAVLMVMLGTGCAAAQSIRAFDGLERRYVASDRIEFQIENASPDSLFYWIQVEMRGDDGWYLVYSSLAGLRNDMSEPQVASVASGETVAINWVPNSDDVFRFRNERGSHEYRFVLKTVLDRHEENPSLTLSSPFFVE
jgi:hypothetical protein